MNYYNDISPESCAWLKELIADGLIPDGGVDGRSIADVKPDELYGFSQCHFFAGIGGWPEAFRLAGFSGPAWSGSCPCQPFSCAGKGLGTKDERHLWPEFFRLIKECKPPFVFGEQVSSTEVVGSQLEASFIIAVQSGDYAKANKLAHKLSRSSSLHYWRRWVDGIRTDLETAGYSVWFRVLGAHSVGAPHIRQRLFWGAVRLDVPERRRTPEELIWINVLADGIACALKEPCVTRRWKNHWNAAHTEKQNDNMKRDAIAWIRSRRTGLGTFRYCCEVIDLDHLELRKKVELLVAEGDNGKIRFSGKKIPKVAAIAAGLGIKIYGQPRKNSKVGEAISRV